MTLTVFSVAMAIVLFTIACAICNLFLSRTKSNHLWIVALVLGLSILRCLFPVEIDGALTVNCWEIYPELFDFTRYVLWRNITVGHVLLAVWIGGSLLFLIRQVIEIAGQLRLISRETTLPADDEFLEIAGRAAAAVGCTVPVEVYTSSDVSVPVMVGVLRPRIILPEHAFTFRESELEYILRHEISHYKDGDIWIRLLVQLLVCLFWWNPPVRSLRSSVIQLLELRCDDRACHSLTDKERLNYSTVLVESLRAAIDRKSSSLFPTFTGKHYKAFLRQRVKILTSPRPAKPAVWKLAVTVSVCVLLFIGSYTLIFQPAYAPPDVSDFLAPTPENSWLIPLSDGMYEVWVEGIYFTTISPDKLETPPFNEMPIYEKENLPK